MIYIGIDPGVKGSITFLEDADLLATFRFEKELDLAIEMLRTLPVRASQNRILLEDIHAVYGSRASATFSFGREVGRIIGILQALGLEFRMIPVKEWQSAMCKMPLPPKKGDATVKEHARVKRLHKIALKRESCRAAHNVFPELNAVHEEVCDSVNIARYCRDYYRKS